jgi:GT2 family glycosyltransferase
MTASTDLSSGLEEGHEHPPTPAVVVAVLFVDERSLPVTLESVRGQVYGVDRLVILGGGDVAAEVARTKGADHHQSFGDFVKGLGPETDYVWMIHGDARPRPDALGALVAETERNEASLVGSKILNASAPDHLESVGAATDVFGEPYTGLDPEEVDLEQYDVVRDVAFVSGVSMLVRRDLLKGLGGLDTTLAPISAGLDFSQRARIAGGRVMVAPSSEVLHLKVCGEEGGGWREQAGRMRAMMKAYRWITLLWAIPAGWVLGLIDGVLRLFLGSTRPLTDLMRASAWNIVRLPSTLRARGSVRAIRATGDEELFRYQVTGSVRLRALGADLASRFGWIIDQEPGVVTEEELEREPSIGGPAGLAVAVLVVGLATRSLWFDRPSGAGFWLPLHPDAASVLGSYAGGWNPAGLGSTQTLHPSAAAASGFQWLLGGWQGAMGVMTGLAVVAAVWGMARLLTRLEVLGAAKWLGGIAYVIGPFSLTFTEAAYWPGLMSLGALPWLVDAVISHPEGHGRAMWGRIGRIVFAGGLTASFAPLAIVVPLVAVLLAMPIVSRTGIRVSALWWAVVALVAGADVIAPYLLGVPPVALTADLFVADMWPSVVVGLALVAAAVFTVAFAPPARARAAGWGGSMVGTALLVGVLPVVTGELRIAAVCLAALGTGLVVGGAIRIDYGSAPSVTAQAIAVLGSVIVLGASLPLVLDGRAGLPAEGWSDRLSFIDALEGSAGADRVLLIGPAEALPGDHREGQGYSYRLLTGAEPTLDQAWLGTTRIGDRALSASLAEVDRGATARPGELLAEFGVRWVAISDDAPVLDVIQSQVDLAERQRLEGWTVYENLASRPRLEHPAGAWTMARTSGAGPAADERIRLADNADPGWSPEWSQSDWANEVSASEGLISYQSDALRLWLAIASAGILVVAGGLAFWGRSRV